MPKSGQARVLDAGRFALLLNNIGGHRHPEKNRAIMQVSFKLGLRAQEIALLELKEVCFPSRPNPATGDRFTVKEIMALPASYTKGANATGKSMREYQRRTVSFKVADFNQVIEQVTEMVRRDPETPVDPSLFYPPLQQHKGQSRDLPIEDPALKLALIDYLRLRDDVARQENRSLIDSEPLFLSQKGGKYTPNSMQSHMGLMLKKWAGIEGASSHSGRRTLATEMIHKQKRSVKVAQKALGHKHPATTLIYEDPPEDVVGEALRGVGASLEKNTRS